jgi:hypothetical protein
MSSRRRATAATTLTSRRKSPLPNPVSHALALAALLAALPAAAAPDYAKRAQPIDPAVVAQLIGRWTNPVDKTMIEITSVDAASGALRGKEWPTTGAAAGDEHELVGWVSAAPARSGFDRVTPVTFTTTLYEYGTLPTWAGFLADGKLVTSSLLVWPLRTYPWDHISAFQETWTRVD